MRTIASTTAVAFGLFSVAFIGCSSGDAPPTYSLGGASPTTAGNGGTAGMNTVAGNATTAGNGGVNSQGGMSGGPSTAGGGMGGSAAGSGGAGGGAVDITAVRPTTGCGMDPGDIASGVKKIATSGMKDANATGGPKGAWNFDRYYRVWLPQGYDKTKAYPLVFQGHGCGFPAVDKPGQDMDNEQYMYPFDDGTGKNVGNKVIRVYLKSPPNEIQHVEAANAGCFDDKEGDDSVDWPFYEKVWDELAGKICFDQNRVFANGNSSGSWLSNELGCKYAGDAKHPIRGVLPNTGGLPTDPSRVPTCSGKPLAGMWIQEAADNVNPFTGTITAINRAMKTNGCTKGANWEEVFAMNYLDNFPIGGGNADTVCKKIQGCPELYPLVVCRLPSQDPTAGNHGSHDNVANPGFSTFLKLLMAP